MKRFIIFSILFVLGLVLAQTEGEFFPWLNLLGVVIFWIGALKMKRRFYDKNFE